MINELLQEKQSLFSKINHTLYFYFIISFGVDLIVTKVNTEAMFLTNGVILIQN
jgi:hypothetical protein